MANTKWADIPFQAWVGVLEPMAEGGFRILIFDYSFNRIDSDIVYLDDLHDIQRAFIRFCQTERNLQINEIWAVRGSRDESVGDNLETVSRWLQSTLPYWRQWPYTMPGKDIMKVYITIPSLKTSVGNLKV